MQVCGRALEVNRFPDEAPNGPVDDWLQTTTIPPIDQGARFAGAAVACHHRRYYAIQPQLGSRWLRRASVSLMAPPNTAHATTRSKPPRTCMQYVHPSHTAPDEIPRVALVCVWVGPLPAYFDYFVHTAAASQGKGV